MSWKSAVDIQDDGVRSCQSAAAGAVENCADAAASANAKEDFPTGV